MSGKQNQSSGKKVIYFKFLAVLLPLFVLVIIELLLRAFSVGDNLDLFIKHPNKKYNDYYLVNPAVGKKYFNIFDATRGTNDIFLRKKPDNCFRLFVLGSSTMVGFPYGTNLMASRILHKRLQDSYPEKEIEVVNTAITAINSITLNDYMKQLVRYEPDAVLIYAGHNEYYGAFGVGSNETLSRNKTVRNIHFKLMNWRLYQMFRSAYTKITIALLTDKNAADSKGSLMKRIVKNKDITYGGEAYRIGLNQYRSNLSEILQVAKDNNIPVFLSSLASNVKDLAPFGESEIAISNYNSAINALQLGDTLKAFSMFYEAKDYDPVRFRAPEKINFIVDSLAEVFNCYFMPVKQAYIESSEAGIIGDNLMTEHVHPNIDGQFLMADVFYNGIVNSKLIAPQTSEYNLKNQSYYRENWGYTALDSLVGTYKVKQLKSYWPFKTLDSKVTFRDLYKPVGYIDSIAFTALTRSNPQFEEMHKDMATLYLGNGNFVNALKEYEALIMLNPYWSNYYNNAANCLLKLNDLYNAEKYLRISLKYDNSHFANLMLGEIESIKHNFKEAAIYYKAAIQFADDDDGQRQAWQKLYQTLHYSKNNVEKEKLSEKMQAMEISIPDVVEKLNFSYSTYLPYNVKQNIERAYAMVASGNLDSAYYLLKESQKINDVPLVNKLIGDILYQKRNNNILHYYTKAYPAYKNNVDFLNRYCIAYYVNKRTDEALQVVGEIKAIDPNYSGLKSLEKLFVKK